MNSQALPIPTFDAGQTLVHVGWGLTSERAYDYYDDEILDVTYHRGFNGIQEPTNTKMGIYKWIIENKNSGT